MNKENCANLGFETQLRKTTDALRGSPGMLVQSEEFIREMESTSTTSLHGLDLNYATWRMAKMNPAIRGVDGKIEQGDSFTNDLLPDLKTDYIIANPPFDTKR